MTIRVEKGFFETKEEVFQDLARTGFWPTTYVSRPSPAIDLHWHDSEVHGYVLQGESWILDGDSGERITVQKGDKLILPEGALHAEGEVTEQMIYIVALPEARPFDEFLRTLPPDDPARPGATAQA